MFFEFDTKFYRYRLYRIIPQESEKCNCNFSPTDPVNALDDTKYEILRFGTAPQKESCLWNLMSPQMLLISQR